MAISKRDDNPVVRFAEHHLWANPEYDNQFQVVMHRISTDVGAINHVGYMGKWRYTPTPNKRFHVYSVGGTHPGFWNMGTNKDVKNPVDKWISAADLGCRRGLQFDVYTNLGRQFPRSKAWIMITFDGLVLLALEHLPIFPIKLSDNMHFRCYSTDMDVAKSETAMEDLDNPYLYETMTYENAQEYATFNTRYSVVRQRSGYTAIFLNGYLQPTMPLVSELKAGDLVEMWHDPAIRRSLKYQYRGLQEFFSDLDERRKLILHPPKTDDFTLRYFDDSDYYLIDRDGKGVYFHRNHESAIRQLTHVDVSISVEQIKVQIEALASLKDLDGLQVLVLERNTGWGWTWGWEAQHICHLYRMDDQNIVRAMTGDRSVLPEWTANELEKGPVQTFLRSYYNDHTTELAHNALGYNAETLAVSQTPVKVTANSFIAGIDVPPTYFPTFTVWEHSEDGQLIEYYSLTNVNNIKPRNARTGMVEFTYGKVDRNIHYDVVRDDYKLPTDVAIQVYLSNYSTITNKPVGDLTDITGSDRYHIENGYIVWDRLDKVNQCAIICYDDVALAHTFTLDHLDKSLCFSIDDIYQQVIGNLPINFAQIDVWLNGHPLIDEVDWFIRDRLIFINSREYLVAGGQEITVRCFGFWKDKNKPKAELELGFVAGGVIGDMKRYNIREDRATRIVVGGRLMLLDDLKTAETDPADDYNNVLNGKPYMVKHTHTPVRYIQPFDHHVGYEAARVTDKRVVDYLTLYCDKSKVTVDFNMVDRYMLYSPFMNVIVNGVLNEVIVPPPLGDNTSYVSQVIEDLVKVYKWWLGYDPTLMNYDLRYFVIMPYANVETPILTNDQLIFIRQVNQNYLNGLLAINGNFEVARNV